MSFRIIGARFPQKCRECKAQIVVGQSIEINTDVKGCLCMNCVNEERHAPINKDDVRAEMPMKRGLKPIRTYEELFGNDD
jgi:hypothetical protein